jgi:hypothetical protein
MTMMNNLLFYLTGAGDLLGGFIPFLYNFSVIFSYFLYLLFISFIGFLFNYFIFYLILIGFMCELLQVKLLDKLNRNDLLV